MSPSWNTTAPDFQPTRQQAAEAALDELYREIDWLATEVIAVLDKRWRAVAWAHLDRGVEPPRFDKDGAVDFLREGPFAEAISRLRNV